MLIHPLAGVLSAYGMGLADVTAMRERAVEAPLDRADLLPELDRVRRRHSAAGAPAAELARQGGADDRPRCVSVRRAHLRYEGTDTALPVPLGPLPQMLADFEQAYRQRFSFLMPDKPIIVEAVSVELAAPSAPLAAPVLAETPAVDRRRAAASGPGRRVAAEHPCAVFGGGWTRARAGPATDLRPGERVAGPAIIAEDYATTVVEPGWRAS